MTASDLLRFIECLSMTIRPAFPRHLSLALTVSVNSAKIISTIRAMTGASNGSDVG